MNFDPESDSSPAAMHNPGKYDPECTAARESTQAVATLLFILGGNRGNGFSVQSLDPNLIPKIPTILRGFADAIESL